MKWAIKTLKKTVTTAGTAEPLSATTLWARLVEIKGLIANTNNAYIGDSAVDSTTGFELDAAEVLNLAEKVSVSGEGDLVSKLPVFDLSQIYVDVDTDGEGVSVVYFEPVS
jgi:hypothetical protein